MYSMFKKEKMKISMNMKTCPHCGALIDDNARFCTKCGQSLQPEPAELPPQPATVRSRSAAAVDPAAKDHRKTMLILILAACLAVCLGFIAYQYFAGSKSAQTSAVTTAADTSSGNSAAVTSDSSGSSASSSSTASTGGYYLNASTTATGSVNYNNDFTGSSATSVHEPVSGITYNVDNLLDSNAHTAWVEGVSGIGEGESVTLTYTGGDSFQNTGLAIYDGYCKSDETFNGNSVPASLEMEVNGTAVHQISFSNTPNLQFVSYDPITIKPGDQITFVIKKVQIAPNDENFDTAISEIGFLY